MLKTNIFLYAISILLIVCGFIFWYLTSYQEGYRGTLDLKNQKVIIFDFDGTLCDSIQIVLQEFNSIAKGWNVKPISDFEKVRHLPLQQSLEAHGVNKWKLPFIKYQLIKAVAPHIPEMKSFPGLPETLIELKKRGYKLGILTSNAYANVSQFLEKHDMQEFDFIYYGSSLFGKARLLKHIKSELNASTLFYVGDENRDIEASAVAKIPFIAVTWGFQSKALLSLYHPQHIVQSPAELLSIL